MSAFSPRAPITYTVQVQRIPDSLNFNSTKSNNASNIFVAEDLKDWFRALINSIDFDFIRPNHEIINESRAFEDYISNIIQEGFTVWNTQGGADANIRLELQDPDGRKAVLSGRPDFIISNGNASLGTYLHKTQCIVEVESKDDAEACRLQMMAYLYIFMNKLGLDKVCGLLIFRNGLVQAYRASRGPDIVYEENDTFHISHIVNVLSQIVNI